jgi:hypothetical protein
MAECGPLHPFIKSRHESSFVSKDAKLTAPRVVQWGTYLCLSDNWPWIGCYIENVQVPAERFDSLHPKKRTWSFHFPNRGWSRIVGILAHTCNIAPAIPCEKVGDVVSLDIHMSDFSSYIRSILYLSLTDLRDKHILSTSFRATP